MIDWLIIDIDCILSVKLICLFIQTNLNKNYQGINEYLMRLNILHLSMNVHMNKHLK